MKKAISIIVVVAVIVGGYIFYKSKHQPQPSENTPVQENSETTAQNPNTSGKKMAFSVLVQQGGSYKCNVKEFMSDVDNSGMVYMSAGKLRGDFSTVAEGQTMNTSVIIRDGFTYNWSSTALGMGVKIKTPDTADGTGAQTTGTYSWDPSQVGDYVCEAWTPDEATFTLPANVKFTEVAAQ